MCLDQVAQVHAVLLGKGLSHGPLKPVSNKPQVSILRIEVEPPKLVTSTPISPLPRIPVSWVPHSVISNTALGLGAKGKCSLGVGVAGEADSYSARA